MLGFAIDVLDLHPGSFVSKRLKHTLFNCEFDLETNSRGMKVKTEYLNILKSLTVMAKNRHLGTACALQIGANFSLLKHPSNRICQQFDQAQLVE